MHICPNCRELYSDEYVEEIEAKLNKGYRTGWDWPGEWQNAECPDCHEYLVEAHDCPICGETMITEDEEVCKDCEKFVRFAQKAYQESERMYYSLIEMYADGDEAALTYMRDLYEEGLL